MLRKIMEICLTQQVLETFYSDLRSMFKVEILIEEMDWND